MNVNVSIDAVNRARAIVDESQARLINNHAAFSSMANNALSQWNDAHVEKFLRLYESMTEDLRSIVAKLYAIDNFCVELAC